MRNYDNMKVGDVKLFREKPKELQGPGLTNRPKQTQAARKAAKAKAKRDRKLRS